MILFRASTMVGVGSSSILPVCARPLAARSRRRFSTTLSGFGVLAERSAGVLVYEPKPVAAPALHCVYRGGSWGSPGDSAGIHGRGRGRVQPPRALQGDRLGFRCARPALSIRPSGDTQTP